LPTGGQTKQQPTGAGHPKAPQHFLEEDRVPVGRHDAMAAEVEGPENYAGISCAPDAGFGNARAPLSTKLRERAHHGGDRRPGRCDSRVTRGSCGNEGNLQGSPEGGQGAGRRREVEGADHQDQEFEGIRREDHRRPCLHERAPQEGLFREIQNGLGKTHHLRFFRDSRAGRTAHALWLSHHPGQHLQHQRIQVPAVSRRRRRQGEPHPDCMPSAGIARAYGRLRLHLRVHSRDGQETPTGDLHRCRQGRYSCNRASLPQLVAQVLHLPHHPEHPDAPGRTRAGRHL
ncbi:unnamed protein product, partial [Laminaria digitata]